MAVAKYPSRKELLKVFYLKHGQLWRKGSKRNPCAKVASDTIVTSKANNKLGYCRIGFYKRLIYKHVVVYILAYEAVPDGYMIDHIDGDRLNNHPRNLRAVTPRDNLTNKEMHRNGKLRGVTKRPDGKFEASIKLDGHQKYLGRFDSEEEAGAKYERVLQRHLAGKESARGNA